MSESFRVFLIILAWFPGVPVLVGILWEAGLPPWYGLPAAIGLVGGFLFWRSRSAKGSVDAKASGEAAERERARQHALVRAQCPWMEDPDDYRLLPSVPDLEKLPEPVAREYVRKHMLRAEAEEQVDRYISEENVLHGTMYTPQQREVLIQRECRQIAAVRDQVDFEINERAAKRGRSQRELQQAVEAIENSTQFGRSLRFKKDHPFLSGLMGEENVDKLTSQGWWKG